jgi:hypothetical protein
MAPLRHAMRFVDRKQRRLHMRQQIETARGVETFRRDVEQVERTVEQAALDVTHLIQIQRRIEEGSAYAQQGERSNLILHQRNQRRHHDRRAGAQQRRHLIAQRFAAARRHEHQSVTATGHMLDDFALRAAEAGMAEHFLEHTQRMITHEPALCHATTTVG